MEGVNQSLILRLFLSYKQHGLEFIKSSVTLQEIMTSKVRLVCMIHRQPTTSVKY